MLTMDKQSEKLSSEDERSSSVSRVFVESTVNEYGEYEGGHFKKEDWLNTRC